MRRRALDLTVLFVIASLVCGYIVLAVPSDRQVTVHVYVLVVGALLMLGLLAATTDTVPGRQGSQLDRALARPPRPALPVAQLERVEREVTLGVASASDLHRRLLPQLREIADARLERSGRSPGPDTLGRWWDLLRPDRPPPEDRFAPGISQAELRELVADLERM